MRFFYILGKVRTVYQVCPINARPLLNWQKVLAQGFSTSNDLLRFLELPLLSDNDKAQQQFASRIPLGFAKRMQKGNPCDPLLLQVLAKAQEMEPSAGYAIDPLEETKTNAVKGIIHKYHGRVLLTVTGTCAVNCRYCFRRHFPYHANNPGRQGWQESLEYIAKDESITEVIFSGGDPLMASNAVLKELIEQLEAIPHVHTLRIHTRIPVVLPERIDEEFVALLDQTRLKKVLVLHSNHAQELNEEVHAACLLLSNAGCHLLNQSVLLAQINDSAEVLTRLSQRLFSIGVLPYYLHLLDKVAGASHFDLPLSKAKELHEQLQQGLPGYLVPRLVREEPGRFSKTLV